MGVTAALGLGSALLGAKRGADQAAAQKRQNMAEAVKTQYSDITGQMGTVKPVTASAIGGALEGGMGGLSLAQKFGKADGLFGGGDKTPAPAPAPMAVAPAPTVDLAPKPIQGPQTGLATPNNFNIMGPTPGMPQRPGQSQLFGLGRSIG